MLSEKQLRVGNIFRKTVRKHTQRKKERKRTGKQRRRRTHDKQIINHKKKQKCNHKNPHRQLPANPNFIEHGKCLFFSYLFFCGGAWFRKASAAANGIQLRSSRRRADETPSVIQLNRVFPDKAHNEETPLGSRERLGGHHPRKLALGPRKVHTRTAKSRRLSFALELWCSHPHLKGLDKEKPPKRKEKRVRSTSHFFQWNNTNRQPLIEMHMNRKRLMFQIET